MYKTTKHTLQYATKSKLDKLSKFINVYCDLVQKYINLILDNRLIYDEGGLSSKDLPIYNIRDSRYRQIAYKQACEIIHRHFRLINFDDIDLKKHNNYITIDERLLDVIKVKSKTFDEFISIKIENPITHKLEKIKLPIQYTKIYNKYIQSDRYILKKSIRIFKNYNNKIYLNKFFQLEDTYYNHPIADKRFKKIKEHSWHFSSRVRKKIENYNDHKEELERKRQKGFYQPSINEIEFNKEIEANRCRNKEARKNARNIINHIQKNKNIQINEDKKTNSKSFFIKQGLQSAIKYYAITNGISINKSYSIFNIAYKQSTMNEFQDLIIAYNAMIYPGLARLLKTAK